MTLFNLIIWLSYSYTSWKLLTSRVPVNLITWKGLRQQSHTSTVDSFTMHVITDNPRTPPSSRSQRQPTTITSYLSSITYCLCHQSLKWHKSTSFYILSLFVFLCLVCYVIVFCCVYHFFCYFLILTLYSVLID